MEHHQPLEYQRLELSLEGQRRKQGETLRAGERKPLAELSESKAKAGGLQKELFPSLLIAAFMLFCWPLCNDLV
jgi:hypothetical protein